MQDPKDQKKAFKGRGLPFGNDPVALAGAVASAMNELSEEGYDVEIMRVPKGLVLLGKRQPPQQEGESSGPLAHILRRVFDATAASSELPERIHHLIKKVATRSKSDDPDVMLRELPSVLPGILKEVPSAAVVKEMAEECENFAANHDKSSHGDQHECSISVFMRAMAKEMRGYARMQVQ